jgi:hypothetical protein
MCKIVIRDGQPYLSVRVNLNDIKEAEARERIHQILGTRPRPRMSDTATSGLFKNEEE